MPAHTPHRPALPRHRPASRRRGFTLIEVLTTILLMAIIVPVAMRAVSASTGAASSAQHRTIAAGLADSKLAELVATGDWQNGGTGGDFGEYYPEYSWQARVDTWATSAAVTQVQVVVSWTTARRGDESLTVATLVYPPGTAAASSTSSSSSTGTGGTP
ncbi:MAG: hypothetical protein JWO31_2222 [Phycisphaerales bacterium]|nr:hypothetical protein [Phycisphaerales bacterium]